MRIGPPAALSIVMLLAISSPAASSTEAGMPRDLDRYITKAMSDWSVPGLAVAIVKDEEVIAAKGDGETIFDIASLTKSFTAAGAAILVDEGKLRWDDRVRERLPGVSFADAFIDHEVTLRDLLSHRTGLQPANSLFRFMSYDRGEILRRVRFLEPQEPFRTGMVYSNVLYAVAGEMIAAAAGTSWAELIRSRVVEPAGMRSTIVETRPAGPNVASPHAVIAGVQQPIRPFDFSMVGPASSIYTNAADMARWLRLQLNEGTIDGREIITRASMAEMHSPQIIIRTTAEMRRARMVEHFAAYGLGWQVMDYRGEPMLWHSGNADGMPSYMALLPRLELGVAVMINTWNAPLLHGALASRIIDFYLGVAEVDWSGEVLTRHRKSVEGAMAQRAAVEELRESHPAAGRPLTDYAGVYGSDLWGDVHVRLEGERLTLQAAEGARADLSPAGHDTFWVLWTDPVDREYFFGTVVAFGESDDDRIVRLTVTLNRDEVEARRRP